MSNHYETLGVSKSATQDDIKKAYRRCAMKYHPDRNLGSQSGDAQFKACQTAYQVLGDPQKRVQYDRLGHERYSSMGGGPSQQAPDIDLSDIFQSIFGSAFNNKQKQQQAQATNRKDIEATLNINFVTAVNGGKIKIEAPGEQTCDPCDGTGSTDKKTTPCPSCKGTGSFTQGRGLFSTQVTCPACNGSGKIPNKSCTSCKGSGWTDKSRTIEIDIPAGIKDGDRIRITNDVKNGARPGSLFLTISIEPDPIFDRQGLDLYCQLPLRLSQAAVGGEWIIETPRGSISIKVPAGTQPGTLLKISGKGVLNPARGEVGHLYCKIQVVVPMKLTEKQRKILEDLDKSIYGTSEKNIKPVRLTQ